MAYSTCTCTPARFTRLGIVKSLLKSHVSSSFFFCYKKLCLDLRVFFFFMLMANVSHRGTKGFPPNQSTAVCTNINVEKSPSTEEILHPSLERWSLRVQHKIFVDQLRTKITAVNHYRHNFDGTARRQSLAQGAVKADAGLRLRSPLAGGNTRHSSRPLLRQDRTPLDEVGAPRLLDRHVRLAAGDTGQRRKENDGVFPPTPPRVVLLRVPLP